MAMSRDELLAAIKAKRSTRTVDLPGLGGEVLVRGLTAKEWDSYQASMKIWSGGEQVGIDDGNTTARLMVRCVVDENGDRILQDTDASVLGDLPITEMNRLAEAVFELSGINEDAQKAVESDLGEGQNGEA